MKYLKLYEKYDEWDFEEESPKPKTKKHEKGDIRCNNCYWVGEEEDLKAFTDISDKDIGNDIGYITGCPNCETDEYLMDLDFDAEGEVDRIYKDFWKRNDKNKSMNDYIDSFDDDNDPDYLGRAEFLYNEFESDYRDEYTEKQWGEMEDTLKTYLL